MFFGWNTHSVRLLEWWSARVCVMILSVCAFLWCWLVVGALLGVWDDTLVVVPVYRLLRAAGRLLLWWFVVWCVGVV